MGTGKPISDEQEQAILRLVERGLTPIQIAAQVRRNPGTIRQFLNRRGIKWEKWCPDKADALLNC